MHGVNEALQKIKDDMLAQEQEADTPSEEIVEDAIDEEELEHDEQEEGSEEADEQEPDSEDEEEDDDAEIEAAEKEGDTKKLRKNIERNFKKRLDAKDAAHAEEKRALEERLRALELKDAERTGFDKANAPVQEEETDPEPDRELEPEDWLAWENRQLRKQIEEDKKAQAPINDYVQQQQVRQGVQVLERSYTQAHPTIDYEGAKQFEKDWQKQQIKLRYPQLEDAHIDAYLDKEEINLFAEANMKGENAAAQIVEMAKAHGWQQPKGKGKKARPNFDAIKKNQRKNASVMGAPDSVKEHDVTPDQIFNMSLQDVMKGGKKLMDKAYKSASNSHY